MKRLYQHAWKRLQSRVITKAEAETAGAAEATSKIAQTLPTSLLNISHDILHRLARDDLRLAVRVPCHVQDPLKEMKVVEASKRLRMHTHTEEAKICFKCPHKLSCPVAGKAPNALPSTAIQDMLTHFEALEKMPQGSVANRIWNSSYKMCDSLPVIIDDLKEGGNQSKEYEEIRQKLIRQAEQSLAQLKKKDEMKNSDKQQKNTKNVDKKKKQEKKVAKKNTEKDEQQSSEFSSQEQEKKSRKQKVDATKNKERRNPAVEKGPSKNRNRQDDEKPRRDPFKDRQRDSRRNSSSNSFGSGDNFVKKQFRAPRSGQREQNAPSYAKNHNKFQRNQNAYQKKQFDSASRRTRPAQQSRQDNFEFANSDRFMRNDGPRQPPRSDRSAPRRNQRSQSYSDKFAEDNEQRIQKSTIRSPKNFTTSSSSRRVQDLYTEASSSSGAKPAQPEANAPSTGRRVRGRRGE